MQDRLTTRPTLLVVCALSVAWITIATVYLYPGVKEEVDEKRYLHRVEKLHTPVLPLECGRARGVENRDFIREDRHSERCWVTIPTFNSLYREIAEATDLGATLRSNIRESLPVENREGTPFEALLRAAGIILAGPTVIALALVTGRSGLPDLSPGDHLTLGAACFAGSRFAASRWPPLLSGVGHLDPRLVGRLRL